jgi:hypothetical protein
MSLRYARIEDAWSNCSPKQKSKLCAKKKSKNIEDPLCDVYGTSHEELNSKKNINYIDNDPYFQNNFASYKTAFDSFCPADKEYTKKQNDADDKYLTLKAKTTEVNAEVKKEPIKEVVIDESNELLDLGLYFASGILLILLMEQFIQIGMKMRF